jgi:hypothetical protein
MSEDKEKTILEVPEEMKVMMRDWQACKDIRDHCIESVFRTRKAIYYTKKMIKLNDKFWELATELHSDIGKKSNAKWSYDLKKEHVYIDED